MSDFDVAVIGAGMAGASAAACLSAHCRVALVEAEEQAGYHTTGRSAAIWILNYGPPAVRVLTGLSRDFFLDPPKGFADGPLGVGRKIIYLAPEEQIAALDALIGQDLGILELGLDEVKRLVPAYRAGYAVRAALEPHSFDMDVAGLHQGFLKQLKAQGGALRLRSRAGRIERKLGVWEVEVAGGAVLRAPIVVNAAGAWADEVAALAGAAPVGLVACRRTAALIDPFPYDVSAWPLVQAADHSWYIRPEARSKLMVTPCDETPMHAHDVRPDELDVAIGIDRMQQALAIEVKRVEHAWAGLRTFSPDRNFVFGYDDAVAGFFWCAGQGGYGIQTAPAAGRLVADMVVGRDPGPAGAVVEALRVGRFRAAG